VIPLCQQLLARSQPSHRRNVIQAGYFASCPTRLLVTRHSRKYGISLPPWSPHSVLACLVTQGSPEVRIVSPDQPVAHCTARGATKRSFRETPLLGKFAPIQRHWLVPESMMPTALPNREMPTKLQPPTGRTAKTRASFSPPYCCRQPGGPRLTAASVSIE